MTHLYRLSMMLLALCSFSILTAQTYSTTLTGRAEVPTVTTLASGDITATLSGTTLTVTGTFDDLASDYNTNVGAHIHLGYAGANGGVEVVLVPTLDSDNRGGSFAAADNTFTLDATQIAALAERRMYVNIHTVDNSSGELRGQLRPQGNTADFTAGLFGTNEVPPVGTMASGGVLIELNGSTLTVTGSFKDFPTPYTMAHLHTGLAGSNGGVDIVLNATVDSDGTSGVFEAVNNTFTVDADQIQGMLDREYYVNLHSQGTPSGEIRGQVVGEPLALFRAALSGGFSVPMNPSLARGQVLGELYPNGDLMVHGSFVGLESSYSAAHLHDGIAGRNGGVLQGLSADVNDDNTSGSFTVSDNTYSNLPDSVAQKMIARGIYLNIHSQDNPSGEARGQMLPEAQMVMTSVMTGTQEVPDVITRGYGQVKVEVNGGSVVFSGSFGNLGSDIATDIAGGLHIHRGAPGFNGPLSIPLAFTSPDNRSGVLAAASNRFELSEGLADSILQRMTYLNLHTVENQGGEIRGQLLLDAANYVIAPLGGASETNPVNSGANGMLLGELFPNRVSMVGGFQGLESDYNFALAGGAHIHNGLAGTNGPITFLLDSDVEADNRSGVFSIDSNVIDLTEEFLDTLRGRGYYVNIHSLDNAPGEIRGQVLPQSRSLFHATLQGINEVPIVQTPAIGSVKAEVRDSMLTLSGSFSGLTSTWTGGAHIHIGGVGETGGVVIPLVAVSGGDSLAGDFMPDMNTYMLDEDDLENLYNGDWYVNVHTVGNAPGEIRGQVVSDPNAFPDAASITTPADGAQVDLTGAPDTPFSIEWTASTDSDNEDVAYTWQLGLDADFTTILFLTELQENTNLDLTFGAVDALLAANGIAVGQSVTLFHRVVTTDGSNAEAGAGNSVEITRGVVSSINNALQQQFKVEVFPTLVRGEQVWVTIDAAERADARLLVTDIAGRAIHSQLTTLLPGEQTIEVSTNGLASGVYFVTLAVEGKMVIGKKIVVE